MLRSCSPVKRRNRADTTVTSALGGMFRIIEIPDVMQGDLIPSLHHESPRMTEILR